jgi:ferredoxin
MDVASTRSGSRPRLPAGPESLADTSKPELYLFHLTGRPGPDADGARHAAPALLAALEGAGDAAWPLLLPGEASDNEPPRPLRAVLEQALEAAGLSSGSVLRRELPRLVGAFAAAAQRHEGPASAGLFETARDRFVEQFDTSADGAALLREELEALRPALPAELAVLHLDRSTLPRLFAAAVQRARESRTRQFAEEVRDLVAQLRERLRLDTSHTERGAAPDALAASLGDAAGLRLDPGMLSRILPAHRGSKTLGDAARARMERSVATLEAWLERPDPGPGWLLVHAGQIHLPPELPGAEAIRHAEPLAEAVRLFDERFRRALPLLTAVRIARLDARGAYRPELHGPLVEHFGLADLTPAERGLLRDVVVLESAERLGRPSFPALLELFASERPLQVLAPLSVAGLAGGNGDPAPESRPFDLARLALGARDTLVLQSSLWDPVHLAASIERAAAAARSALIVAGVPAWHDERPPGLELAAAVHGRLLPQFVHDPEGGETWADRFAAGANPQADAPWPRLAIAVEASDEESPADVREAFTAVHAATLFGEQRSHLLPIEPEAWADDQVPLEAFLSGGDDRVGLPWIWVAAGDELKRAIVSRALVERCRERMRAWRAVQELGGIRNEHARRAAIRAREEAEEQARQERERLEAEHAERLEEVRSQTAAEAMERLVAGLMRLDTGEPAVGEAAAPAPPAPETEAEAPPPADEAQDAEPAAEPADELDLLDEPYIDTVLCTSCNDCININGKLFRYNGNKQAEIGDPAAGTFQQLVIAAEKCPARCIHPGAPPAGDASVTDELIERARAFR